jgi:hypothetical protein
VPGVAVGDDRFDATLAEASAVGVGVIAAVGDHCVGPLAGTSWQAGDCGHTVEQPQQLSHVVAVAARQRPRERDPLSVGQEVVLGARAAPVNRARARFGAPLAECGSGCQCGGGRHRVVGAVVAARGSSLSLVRGRGAGDMMVDRDSRGRAVSGRPVFCGQRRAGARAWHGAFGSRPEGFEGRIDDVMDAGAVSSGQLGIGSSAASPIATSAW